MPGLLPLLLQPPRGECVKIDPSCASIHDLKYEAPSLLRLQLYPVLSPCTTSHSPAARHCMTTGARTEMQYSANKYTHSNIALKERIDLYRSIQILTFRTTLFPKCANSGTLNSDMDRERHRGAAIRDHQSSSILTYSILILLLISRNTNQFKSFYGILTMFFSDPQVNYYDFYGPLFIEG